mmetsp:Transcript_141047/g.351788  ORF Transcript_141047/g.351788 Transcript_141047/m.351788 type:complete len:393 (-) Transcript_141047:75-1253(-)
MITTDRQIVVSSLSGPLCVVNAHATMSVLALKRAVEAKTGIPCRDQRLLFGTLELADDQDKLSRVLGAGSHNVTLLRRSIEQASWLRKLSKAGWHQAYALLRDAPEHIRGSREIVRVAIEENYQTLKFASDDIRSDRNFLRDLFKRKGTHCLDFASDELRRNRDFVLSVARSYEHDSKHCRFALECAAKELWSDRVFVLAAVMLVPQLIERASDELRADRSIMLAVVESSNHTNKLIRSIPKQLLSDRKVALAVASRSRWILPHLPPELCAEISSTLRKNSSVSRVSSSRQGRRTAGAPHKVPSERTSRASTPACHQPLEEALALLEPYPLKELRVAWYCRQSLSKARRLRRGAYRKAREDTMSAASPRKGVPRLDKQQLLGELSDVHEMPT